MRPRNNFDLTYIYLLIKNRLPLIKISVERIFDSARELNELCIFLKNFIYSPSLIFKQITLPEKSETNIFSPSDADFEKIGEPILTVFVISPSGFIK